MQDHDINIQWCEEMHEQMLRRRHSNCIQKKWLYISIALNVLLAIGFIWTGNLYLDIVLPL